MWSKRIRLDIVVAGVRVDDHLVRVPTIQSDQPKSADVTRTVDFLPHQRHQVPFVVRSARIEPGPVIRLIAIPAERLGVPVEAAVATAKRAAFFDADPARANIAEVAFGVNDKAEVTGEVLEDEKAGFHWAFGRSDHLGGVVGVDYFESPENVVHQDIVYAKGNPIQVERATIIHPDGRQVVVIDEAEYKI